MVKVLVCLPKQLLDTVDAYCQENNYNRSEFLRYAMRIAIGEIKKEKIKDGIKESV